VGGGISKIYVYKDGSGLAYTWTDGKDWKRVVVASAGYVTTALLGAFFLLMRRTRRGPTAGLLAIGCVMLLSCALYVRNAFGIGATLLIGIFLLLAGWQLPERIILYLYCFLAATCSFNALDAINDLMNMNPGEAYVNGQESSTDAHTVSDIWGMTYQFWALIWLIFGLIMSTIGLLLPFNGLTYLKNQNEQRKQRRQAEKTAFAAGGSATTAAFSSQVPYGVAPSIPAAAVATTSYSSQVPFGVAPSAPAAAVVVTPKTVEPEKPKKKNGFFGLGRGRKKEQKAANVVQLY
jgi:Peptidase M50B-like